MPLAAPARRLLALLAALEQAETPVPVLAAYAGLSTATALRHLQHLTRIGLARRGKAEPGSYRIALTALPVRPEPPSESGRRRAAAWYLGCAFQAALVLGAAALPGAEQIPPDPDRPPTTPVDRYRALDWFAGERDRLVPVLDREARARDDARAWRLAVLVLNIGCFAGPWDGWRAVHRIGMAAALRDLHRPAQAMLEEYAGKLELTGGDAKAARRRHRRSLKLRTADGDARAVVRSVNALGVTWLREGELRKAETLFDRAFDLARAAGDEEFTTFARMNLGAVYARSGRTAEAVTTLHAAINALRAAGRDPYVANALEDLAVAYRLAGDLPRAKRAALDAVRAAVSVGVPMFLPGPLLELACIHIARDRPKAALVHLYEARGVYLELGDELRAAHVELQIARLRS